MPMSEVESIASEGSSTSLPQDKGKGASGPTGIIKRRKVVDIQKFGDLTVKFFEGIANCQNAPVVLGLPTLGLTPVITANFIVEQLKLPVVGSLVSSQLPPSCVLSKSQPSPGIRICGDQRVVVCLSEAKFPESLQNSLIAAVLGIARKIHSKMVYSVEGVPTETLSQIKRAQLDFITTDPQLAETLIDHGHRPLGDAVIAGVTGGLLAEVTDDEGAVNEAFEPVEFTCLLANASSLYPDAASAVVLIKTLAEHGGWEIDTSPLESSAQKIESKVNLLMAEGMESNDRYHTMFG